MPEITDPAASAAQAMVTMPGSSGHGPLFGTRTPIRTGRDSTTDLFDRQATRRTDDGQLTR